MVTVDALKSKASEWARKVIDLNSMIVPPELQPEKDRLLSFAKKVKESIEAVFGTMEEFENAGLGFVPIVGIAAVGAAAAAITYWTTDYVKFVKTVNLYNDNVNAGMSREQSAEIAKNIGGSGKGFFSFNLSNLLVPAALIGGGYLFLKKFE